MDPASSPTAAGRLSPIWGSLPLTLLRQGASGAPGGALITTSSVLSARGSWASLHHPARSRRRHRPPQPAWADRRQTWIRCTVLRCLPTPPAATCTRTRSPSTTARPPAADSPTRAMTTTPHPKPPWMAAFSP